MFMVCWPDTSVAAVAYSTDCPLKRTRVCALQHYLVRPPICFGGGAHLLPTYPSLIARNKKVATALRRRVCLARRRSTAQRGLHIRFVGSGVDADIYRRQRSHQQTRIAISMIHGRPAAGELLYTRGFPGPEFYTVAP